MLGKKLKEIWKLLFLAIFDMLNAFETFSKLNECMFVYGKSLKV